MVIEGSEDLQQQERLCNINILSAFYIMHTSQRPDYIIKVWE
jgi:hypothetical protein